MRVIVPRASPSAAVGAGNSGIGLGHRRPGPARSASLPGPCDGKGGSGFSGTDHRAMSSDNSMESQIATFVRLAMMRHSGSGCSGLETSRARGGSVPIAQCRHETEELPFVRIFICIHIVLLDDPAFLGRPTMPAHDVPDPMRVSSKSGCLGPDMSPPRPHHLPNANSLSYRRRDRSSNEIGRREF
jgi:hypothetical protein